MKTPAFLRPGAVLRRREGGAWGAFGQIEIKSHPLSFRERMALLARGGMIAVKYAKIRAKRLPVRAAAEMLRKN